MVDVARGFTQRCYNSFRDVVTLTRRGLLGNVVAYARGERLRKVVRRLREVDTRVRYCHQKGDQVIFPSVLMADIAAIRLCFLGRS